MSMNKWKNPKAEKKTWRVQKKESQESKDAKENNIVKNGNEHYEYCPQCRVGKEKSEGWRAHLRWSTNGLGSERQS